MKKVRNILSPWKVILIFPLLFFFSLSQIYAADITLEWDANTEPDLDHYVVYWGTSPRAIQDYPDNSGNIDKSQTSYTITGLTAGQVYYFAAKAVDTEGLESDYCDEIDTKAPQITSPPTITSITDTTATIEWTTDEPGNSEVQYQYGSSSTWGIYLMKVTDPSMVTSHSVDIPLGSEEICYYMVGSTDAGGAGPNISDTDNNPSEEFDFFMNQGPDTNPPVITSPPTVTSITNSDAVITWQTDEPSNSQVQYGPSSGTWGMYNFSENDAEMVTSHSVTLTTGLTQGTKYYFRVGSTDGAPSPGPYTTTSNEANFTTETVDDTTPPQITSPPTVTGTTQTMAIIEWETDEPSTSEVRYDIGSHEWEGYPQGTRVIRDEDTAHMVTIHSVTLTGLTQGNTYYFRVGSTDGAPPPGPNGPVTSYPNGYENCSDEISFTTETEPDEPPQITSPPTVTTTTDSTAVVEWQTDEPSNSQVQYGPSSGTWGMYNFSENDAEMVTSHSVTLTTGLTQGTKYYFRVGSTDAFGYGPVTSYPNGYENCSDELSFTTTVPDTAAPVISNVSDDVTIVIIKTNDTAIITWTTDEPSNSMVQYDTSSTWGNYDLSENDAGMVTTHRVTLTGLTSGTYYFRVGSTDASGNGPDLNSNSTNPSINEYSFDTGLDDTDPPVISPPTETSITDTTAVIEWQTDEPSNSMVQYSTSQGFHTWGNYPSSENDAGMVTTHRVTLTGLAPNTTHYYRVGSTDAFGNAASLPSEQSFTTQPLGYEDTIPPQITLLPVVNITESTAVIEWTTDELSNSMVQYQKDSGSTWENYIHSENDAEMVTSHSVTLTGLEDNSTYYFRVGSTDAFNNSPNPTYPNLNGADGNCSVERSFNTTERSDITRPYITGYTVDYFNDTITITYSEANIQNATIEANYLFSNDDLSFRTPGGSDDITYIGNNTYQLFLADIPDDISFTVQALSGITDESGNSVTDDEISINVGSDPDRIKEVLPHHNAGTGIGDDTTWIPNNTSFAVRIEDSDGIDTTDNESIIFTIDDGVNFPYEYNLGYGQVRVVQLDPTEDLNNLTKLWVVYDRSTDDAYGNAYSFDTTVEINVYVKNRLGQEEEGIYSFKIETQEQHDDAVANPLPFTPSVDSPSSGQTTLSIDPGDSLEGAEIVFDSSEPVPPTFGPLLVLGIDEPPFLNISNVQRVENSRLSLQPPTVFNNPVTIFIPCPGHPYASTLNIYRYTGTNWVLAYDVGGNVATGGEGWIVPGSRVNHDNGSPSTIEIQVYHFTGVQAGFSYISGGNTDAAAGGGCFIATAAYGSKMDKHVKILSEFKDKWLANNHLGQRFITFYNKFSPPIADFLRGHPNARAAVKYTLIPITGIAYISLSINPLVLLFVFIFMLLTGVYCARRLNRPRRNIYQ